jgi:hypothetical protein
VLEIFAICGFVAIVICITAFAISIVNASVRIKKINADIEIFNKKEENKNGNAEDDSQGR